jgi:hypothetical protein
MHPQCCPHYASPRDESASVRDPAQTTNRHILVIFLGLDCDVVVVIVVIIIMSSSALSTSL